MNLLRNIGDRLAGRRKQSPEIDFHEMILQVFKSIGAKPEHIVVPNVLVRKGEELLELYVCPQRIGDLYGNEEAARRDLGEGETLYRVNIRRVE